MKYSITKLNDNNYDLYGIKLDNGSKCIYWSNKDINEYNEIIVIFDNKNVVNVSDGQVCISLNGVSDREDATDMINAFGRELYKDNNNITEIKFKFIIDNREEEEIVNKIMDLFRLNGDIVKSEKYSYLTENLDDALSNISIKIPEKKEEDNKENLELLSDVEIDKDNDVDISREEKNDNIEEEGLNKTLELSNIRKQILNEWLKDPVKREEISLLSREELGRKLLEATEDYEDLNSDNTDVKNDVVNNNIEEKESREEDNELFKIDKKPILDNDSFNKNNLGKTNIYLKPKEDDSINNKGVDESFWDDDLTIMDAPIARKNNSNNSIDKMGTGKVKVLRKPKTQVYSKKDKKQAAFVSVPAIIFIISLLLLIGSVIVLFLMK